MTRLVTLLSQGFFDDAPPAGNATRYIPNLLHCSRLPCITLRPTSCSRRSSGADVPALELHFGAARRCRCSPVSDGAAGSRRHAKRHRTVRCRRRTRAVRWTPDVSARWRLECRPGQGRHVEERDCRRVQKTSTLFFSIRPPLQNFFLHIIHIHALSCVLEYTYDRNITYRTVAANVRI